MATIGIFKKSGEGYSGNIRTLALDVEVSLIPVVGKGENLPDFKVMVLGRIDIGAGWIQTGKQSGRSYVFLKIDDPSLPAPITANLFAMRDGDYELIWTRG